MWGIHLHFGHEWSLIVNDPSTTPTHALEHRGHVRPTNWTHGWRKGNRSATGWPTPRRTTGLSITSSPNLTETSVGSWGLFTPRRYTKPSSSPGASYRVHSLSMCFFYVYVLVVTLGSLLSWFSKLDKIANFCWRQCWEVFCTSIEAEKQPTMCMKDGHLFFIIRTSWGLQQLHALY